MRGCALGPVFALALYLPHEGAQSPLKPPEAAGSREREADQGLTHHSRDPSGAHVPGPEFCLTMSRMVASQVGSLAEGVEKQGDMEWPSGWGRSVGGAAGFGLGLGLAAQEEGVTLVKSAQDNSAPSFPEFCPVDRKSVSWWEEARPGLLGWRGQRARAHGKGGPYQRACPSACSAGPGRGLGQRRRRTAN